MLATQDTQKKEKLSNATGRHLSDDNYVRPNSETRTLNTHSKVVTFFSL